MASSKDRIVRKLVEKALEFQRLAPWKQFGGEDVFLLEIPGEEQPVLGTVMGAAGEVFGFALYPSPDAVALMLRMLGGEPPEQVSAEQSLIGFTFERLHELPKPARRFLDQAGFSARREASAPLFVCKPIGQEVRNPRTTDSRVLLYGLSGFLRAWQAGELRPRNLRHSSGLQTTILSGSPARPDHRTVEAPLPEPRPAAPIELDLSGLPILDECWLATVTGLEGGIEGEDQVLRALFVVDRDSQDLLCCHNVLGVGIEEASAQLAAHVRGENRSRKIGLPRELRFASKSLEEPLRATLEAAGVSVKYAPEQPLLEQVADLLRESMRTGEPPERVPSRPTDPLLGRWKAEEYDLFQQLLRHQSESENERYRSLQRYFGEPVIGEELLEDLEDYGIQVAFCEWWAAHHRQKSTAPTLIERLLAAPAPWSQEQRELLRSRQRAHPGLFRVVGTDPAAGTVRLNDLLTDAPTTIHDQGLADCLRDNLIVPLALLPAGPFIFALPQGPPIPFLHLDSALKWLKRHHFSPKPAAFRKRPHLLGRLWEWFDDLRDIGPPRLANTDGDPLEWQTASFSLGDADAVELFLRQRDDVDPPDEGEPSIYHWFRQDPQAPQPPQPKSELGPSRTLLGSIQIIGAELILEVNSRARLDTARDWLERIPGVRFQSVQSKDILNDPSPLDDRLPGPPSDIPPAEMAALLRQVIHQYAMKWLDDSIPMLGGQTPRQAVKTAAGRQQVTLMIRSWPSQAGPDGQQIAPPREEMLKELGLE